MSDANQPDNPQRSTDSGQDRLAKLRALGREMELRARLDILRAEMAAREQHHRNEEQRLEAEIERARTQIENERRIAADRERELQAHIENGRQQLQMVLNSRSWKLTKPLRAVLGKSGGEPSLPGETTLPLPPREILPPQTPAAAAPEVEEIVPPPSSDVKVPAAAASSSVAALPAFVTGGKEAWDAAGSERLQQFLASERRLSISAPAEPLVSVIIALLNKAHLTFLCLESLLQNGGNQFELVLVDNGSTDTTEQLLDRIDGAKIIRNRSNAGFGAACMQGAAQAAAEFLCFLNNDVFVVPGAFEIAAADFRELPNVGAIGGKLLLSDGHMQEAGSIIWSDGTAWGYGRADDAASPKYAFRRPVDYCSGALLFTPRSLFSELQGFDERFLPAYYEDTDYCFKVWESGRSVIYEPRAAVHHYESASVQSSDAATNLIADHRAKFVAKWQAKLERQLPLEGAKVPYARIAVQAGGARIVYMSARLPHRAFGEEETQANELLTRLSAAGHHITCASLLEPLQLDEYTDIPREIEVADVRSDAHFVYRELMSQYDVVWIAGREAMQELLRHLWNMDERIAPIIYQPGELPEPFEAPSTDGTALTPRFEEEITCCQAADIVLVHTEADRRLLLEHRIARVELFSPDTVDRLLTELSRQ